MSFLSVKGGMYATLIATSIDLNVFQNQVKIVLFKSGQAVGHELGKDIPKLSVHLYLPFQPQDFPE